MKLRSALILAAFIVSPLHSQVVPGGEPCPDTGLSMQRAANGHLLVKWHAAAGTTQLYYAPTPGDPASWTPLPGAVPAGVAGGGLGSGSEATNSRS